MNSILGRISIIFVVFILISVGNFVLTVNVLSEQGADGLIINLSGRQRMLSQKLIKEVFMYQVAIKENDEKIRNTTEKQIESSLKVFETTLFALKEGGSIPTNLDMTKFRDCPKASSKETIGQLDKVIGLWDMMKKNIKQIVESQGTNATAINYVSNENLVFLDEINKSVELMQKEAEGKVSKIYYGQITAVIFGVFISLFGFVIIKKSIVDPLLSLSKASDAMSAGNLDKEIEIKGTKEILTLSQSINKMRISLDGMMKLLKNKAS